MKKGWETKRIGDLCEVIAGQSPEGKFYNTDGKGMAFYQGKKDFGEKYIEAPTTWTTQVTRIAQEGDILMSVRAPVGPVNFAIDEICIGRGLAAIRSRAELNRDFLFYQLWHLQPEIAGREGAVFASINKSEIEALPLAFAPLPEQQRIVGILDEAFEGIATAKANAEKNLQNARAVFESYLNEVFTKRGDRWVTKEVGEVSDFEGGSQPPKSRFVFAPRRGYVRFLQIRDFGSEQHVTFIPESSKNRMCREEDVMIGRYGASVGKILTGKAGAYNVALVKTIPDLTVINRNYFYHYLLSAAFQKPLANVAARSAQNGFSKEDIYGFPIPVPSLEEQQEIVGRIGPLSEATQHLESIYQRKVAALEEFKKSLVHQAFNGEL